MRMYTHTHKYVIVCYCGHLTCEGEGLKGLEERGYNAILIGVCSWFFMKFHKKHFTKKCKNHSCRDVLPQKQRKQAITYTTQRVHRLPTHHSPMHYRVATNHSAVRLQRPSWVRKCRDRRRLRANKGNKL